MIDLSVNVNKIALIRNSREGNNPDLVNYAERCIQYGVQGITVHPRPDQRHIRANDIMPLAELCEQYPDVEYNIEGNPFAGELGSYPGFLKLVEAAKPDQVTLVPDNQTQLTSDHGFDLFETGNALRPIIERCHAVGARVSLFMDPDLDQIKQAKEVGADRIELYTGPFAEAWNDNSTAAKECFAIYAKAAEYAASIGLEINAGHDLNLDNMTLFKQLPKLAEVSIGHALTIESLEFGLEQTIQRYLALTK